MMIHIWPYIGFIAANTFSHFGRSLHRPRDNSCHGSQIPTYREPRLPQWLTPRGYMNMSKMCGYYDI